MRVPILHTTGYKDAVDAKVKLVAEYPDRVFQIRKKHNGFTLVERTFPGNQEPDKPSKKRKKRRGITF